MILNYFYAKQRIANSNKEHKKISNTKKSPIQNLANIISAITLIAGTIGISNVLPTKKAEAAGKIHDPVKIEECNEYPSLVNIYPKDVKVFVTCTNKGGLLKILVNEEFFEKNRAAKIEITNEADVLLLNLDIYEPGTLLSKVNPPYIHILKGTYLHVTTIAR